MDKESLARCDYDARELIWLYNQIPVDTTDSCAGHIRSGKPDGSHFMQFLPRLKIVPAIDKVIYGRPVCSPEKYVYRGKEVQLSDLVRGTFSQENPEIYPVEEIESLRCRGYVDDLRFTGARILGLESDTSAKSRISSRLRCLESEFRDIFSYSENPFKGGLSFSTRENIKFGYMQYPVETIETEYGSLDEYCKQAIEAVLAQQKRVYEFWTILTEACRDVLGVTRADFEAVMA